MKLIVGLGNPGPQYELTPHNLGHLTVDRIASDYGVAVRNRHCRALTGRIWIGDETVLLAKPETFMNLSGDAVRCLLEAHEQFAKNGGHPIGSDSRIVFGVAFVLMNELTDHLRGPDQLGLFAELFQSGQSIDPPLSRPGNTMFSQLACFGV